MKPDYETLIVGARVLRDPGGHQPRQGGLGDYQIIRAGDGVGGTWYWNTYPGIAVDIPSFSYQFSFEGAGLDAPTRRAGTRAYAEHCVDKGTACAPRSGSTPKVLGARFDDDDSLWRLELDGGAEITGRFLINASGVLITRTFPTSTASARSPG